MFKVIGKKIYSFEHPKQMFKVIGKKIYTILRSKFNYHNSN